MSKRITKSSVGAGVLFALPFTFALAGLAVAHPGGPGPREGRAAPTPEMQAKMKECRADHHKKVLAELDKDKNGEISPEERKLGHEARKAARLAKYDKDKSGDLSEAERADARHDRMVEKFEELDANSNAEISKAEAEASCSPAGRHFDKVDADGSGSVSWTEFEAAAKKFMKRGRRGMKGHRGKRGHRGERGQHLGPGRGKDAQ